MNYIVRHRTVIVCGVLGLLGSLSGWIWALAKLQHVSLPVIIHFAQFSGITQVGSRVDIVFLGIVLNLIVTSDVVLAGVLNERDHFLGTLLGVCAVVFGGLIFIGFAAMIYVNS